MLCQGEFLSKLTGSAIASIAHMHNLACSGAYSKVKPRYTKNEAGMVLVATLERICCITYKVSYGKCMPSQERYVNKLYQIIQILFPPELSCRRNVWRPYSIKRENTSS